MSYQLLETPGSSRRPSIWSRLPVFSRRQLILASLASLFLLTLAFGHDQGADAVQRGAAKAKEYGEKLSSWANGLGEDEDSDEVFPALGDFEAAPDPKLGHLEAMLGGKERRFLVKDGWASYGFNNQRYMIESTLILAKIADRIPIIPDAIWARACAAEKSRCDASALLYFNERNSHPEVFSCTWNDPGPVWKIGIENFLDLAHLRKSYGPVLTFSEFFTLYRLSPAVDETQVWQPSRYTPPELSSATLPEGAFQNRTFVRVDRPPASPPSAGSEQASDKLDVARLKAALDSKAAWSLQKAREALKRKGARVEQLSDDELVKRLEELGAVGLFTFSDEVLMNKAVTRPTTEVALRSKVESLTSTLSSAPFADASIVYLQGNLHDQRKPGGLHFSTAAARDDFASMVLRGMHAPQRIREVGELLAQRMSEKAGGRRWTAAHLRRGDFVNISWSPSKDAVVHFNKTRAALQAGVKELEAHFSDRLPLVDDPFYLATDESNTTSLAHYRSHGAILLSDLIQRPDLDRLGPTGSYTDILAVVEQQVLARSDFFVGSELSSTSGGAIDDRLALGKEDWSWALLKKDG
ncbi:hypothetical protein JCM10207_004633 [Rhodosporidiobolus poonsookiae]